MDPPFGIQNDIYGDEATSEAFHFAEGSGVQTLNPKGMDDFFMDSSGDTQNCQIDQSQYTCALKHNECGDGNPWKSNNNVAFTIDSDNIISIDTGLGVRLYYCLKCTKTGDGSVVQVE